MAQHERYGHRDLTYSIWHRIESIGRFIDKKTARYLSQIDLDGAIYIEYNDGSYCPVALVETAIDTGRQDNKCASVTERLAEMSGLPAFIVLYEISHLMNPEAPAYSDISKFRVKCIWPREQRHPFKELTPAEYANFLADLRDKQRPARAA